MKRRNQHKHAMCMLVADGYGVKEGVVSHNVSAMRTCIVMCTRMFMCMCICETYNSNLADFVDSHSGKQFVECELTAFVLADEVVQNQQFV